MSYPIIYKPGTTDFDNLGLGLLTDTEKAIVTEELNGQFIFEFTYPVGGALDSAIEEQAFVKVDAGNVLKGQIFEIKKITSDTTYNRSVYAEHISYRLNGIPTKAYTATGNGLQMLTAWKAQLLYGSDLFTVKSDVTTQSTGTFTPQTFGNARTVLGGQEGSILDLVGGQYKFDNFEVSLLNQRGKESHDMLVYGKNITTLTQEENITSTYNAIYPYAQFTDDSDSKKTIVKTLPETIVESKYFDNFNAPVIQVVDFSDKFTGDNAIKSYTDDKLRAFAKQYITNNKIGIPEVSIDLSTVDMNKALGENVESLDLGDTIKVYFQALRINTLAQVSAITWNVLLDQYDSYTIGAKKRTLTQQFINNVSSAKETADKALHIAQGAAIASADGKNTDYYGNSINDPFPTNPKVGDKYFVKDGDDEYIFMWDGTTWVELVSTKTGEYIANKVDEAIETAKSQAAAMDAVRANEAAEFQSEANIALSSAASERESLAAKADSIASSAAHQLQLATSERTAFSSSATSMSNSAASRADSMASSAAAYGKAQASSALSSANVALSEAETRINTTAGSAAKSMVDTATATAHSEAQQVAQSANQALADAKKDLGDDIQKNHADIVATQEELSSKVSQSDYDTKTKDLDTKYAQVKQTADGVTTDVASYKLDNDKKVSANTAQLKVVSDEVSSKVSQTEYNQKTGQIDESVSQLKQRADGFESTVTKVNNLAVGGRNYIPNSDLKIVQSDGVPYPYKSNLGTTVNGSEFSHKMVTTSLYVDIKNITSFSNGFNRVLMELIFFDVDGNKLYVSPSTSITQSYLKVGDSFSGRITAFKNLTNVDIDPNKEVSVGIYIQGIKADYIEASRPKLEIGTIATDWTPAPEDVQSGIETNTSSITQLADEVKTKVAKSDYDKNNQTLNNSISTVSQKADGVRADVEAYQKTNDGKVSSNTAAIDVNSKAITTKVSQSDYDKKTKDLDTKYGQVKTTADAVTADVASYKSTNDKKVNANTASINVLNNQITSKVSQTDFDKTTGDLSGKYSVQQQTINGISQTVTELQAKANAQGQVNQLMNTEFSPDLQGWSLTADTGSNAPYASFAAYGSRGIGFNTVNADASTFARLSQTILLPTTRLSTDVMSLTWRVNTRRMDNYCHIWLVWQDVNGVSLGKNTMGNWNDSTLNKYNVLKWENISIPIDAKQVDIRFETREGTSAYIFQPMVSFTNTIGDYVPGNYNNNARVAAVELGIDHITGLVNDPNNGLSATATLAANGLSVATKAQSDATTAIQKADGIKTTVESMQSINQLTNTEFNPDLEGWQLMSTDGKHSPYRSYLDKNAKATTVGFYTLNADTSSGSYFSRFRQNVPLGTSSNGYLSVSWQSYLNHMDDGMYGHLWILFRDKDGNNIFNSTGANPMGNWINNGQVTWSRQKLENIEIPNAATSVDISFEAREGIQAYLARPMVVFDSHIGDVYIAGGYNNNSSMQSIRTQLADQITDEVEDRKTGDKSTVTQLTGVINQKVIDITQGYTSLNTQTSQLFETKIKNVADQVNSMGQSNLLINSEFNPDLEGWYTEGTNSVKQPYRSYTQGNINATVVGWDTTAGADTSYSRFRQQVQLSSTPLSGQYISMSWYANARTTTFYNNLWLTFYDSKGNKAGDAISKNWADLNGHSPSGQNSWNVQNKWEGIAVPDGATQLNVSFEAREGTNAYLGHPMLVLGATIGSYTPGPYNNNNLVESTRTQLAGMIQDKVDDVGGQIKSLSTQTAGQFTTEIQDRKNGDTNTLSQSKSYTTSQIASAKSGLESEISQSADGIMASVSQVNRLFNTQFTPDLQGWNVANNGANGKNYNFYRSYVVDGETTVGINVPTDAGNDTTKWYSYFEQDVAVPGNNGNTVFSLSWDVRTITNTNYTSLWFSFLDSNHKNVNSDLNVLKYWNGTDDGTWYSKKVENISVPTDAKYIRVSFQCREGTNAYLKRPMLTFTKAAQPYMPGSYMATDTVLQLFKDNWAIGIQDNSGKLITGINGDTSNTRIVGKQITLDGNVSVTGDFYALGGNFKNLNASNITVGTLNGANLNIINLDAGSISTGTLNGAKANITNINASNINTGNFNASLITTGQLNAKVLTGDTGHLGTTDTGRIINKQDNHLQLAAKSMYNNSTNRAQLELLANTSDVDDSMKGTLNYYSNPTNSGHGLGIRFKANQILAIDEDGGSKNLYLSPYSGGQVRIVSRDLSTYYDIAAAHFNVSSQRKFKTNITDLEDNALDIVNNTKIHRYTKNGQTEIGVIADETDERLLTDDKKFVSIYDYTSVLYKAVQELSAEIEALKNERSNSQQPSD